MSSQFHCTTCYWKETLPKVEKEREILKLECEMKQKQLRELELIYQKAKENYISSLPEIYEIFKALNEIPKEHMQVLDESGLNSDIVSIVEEKQRSLTLDVAGSFRHNICVHIDTHVMKIDHSIKLLKDYLTILETTLHSKSLLSVREFTDFTEQKMLELENEKATWGVYKAKLLPSLTLEQPSKKPNESDRFINFRFRIHLNLAIFLFAFAVILALCKFF